MVDTLIHAFVPIVKSEKHDDGTITVYGKATGPDLDDDLQIADPAWLAKAMPAWFARGANVREMHQMNAVGVGTELDQQGEDWWLKALIVDPLAVKKVESKVYTGFSFGAKGGKVVRDKAARGGRIIGGDIVEMSLADAPVNATCKLTIAKALVVGDSVQVPEGGTIDAVVDRNRKLVKVETIEADEPAPVDIIEALDARLVKATEGDVELGGDELPLIQAAINAVAQLIQMEAAELPTDSSEAWDIDTLLCALRALRDFWFSEAASGEVPDPVTVEQLDELTEEGFDMATLDLNTVAELVKSAKADDATDEQKAGLEQLEKALAGEETETSTDDITKAITSAVELAVKPLADELAEVKKAAAPGGPVKARSNTDATKASQHDQLTIDAARYRRLAGEVTDNALREGYLAKAQEADRALRSLAAA